MSWLDGEAVEPVLDAVTPHTRPRPGPEAFSAVDALVAPLHAVVPTKLFFFGRPDSPTVSPGKGGSPPWTTVMQAEGVSEFVETGGDGLATTTPRRRARPRAGPSRARGLPARQRDVFRRDLRSPASLDWEIWSVGDPRLDLGYFALFRGPGQLSLHRIAGSRPLVPSECDLVAALPRSVRRASTQRVPWFESRGSTQDGRDHVAQPRSAPCGATPGPGPETSCRPPSGRSSGPTRGRPCSTADQDPSGPGGPVTYFEQSSRSQELQKQAPEAFMCDHVIPAERLYDEQESARG